MLSELSSKNDVKNVFIFISDSLRHDCLNDTIAEKGVTFKAGAAAPMTASSLPSIFTGRYPASHKVWGFTDRLPERPSLFGITDDWGFNSTMWGHLPPARRPAHRILRIETQAELDDLDEPFIYVEHDHGGHSPYGHSLDEYTSTEFFDAYADRPEQIRTQYQRGVDASAERFLHLVNGLKRRGTLDSTLVIFIGDHGEILGESNRGGLYGHGAPIIPELVYIPVVFFGAGLPHGIRADKLLSGTDIAPTVLAALGETVPENADGTNLWDNSPGLNRHVRSELWQRGRQLSVFGTEYSVSEYMATSLWSQDGGYVKHLNSQLNRLFRSQYSNYLNHAHASVLRKNWSIRKQVWLMRIYGCDEIRYGDPDFDRAALAELPRNYSDQPANDEERVRSAIDRDQLEQLGYIE